MGAVAGGDGAPGFVAAKFPEDSVDEGTLIKRGTAAPTRRPKRREKGLDEAPLFVGEVHFLIKYTLRKQPGTNAILGCGKAEFCE